MGRVHSQSEIPNPVIGILQFKFGDHLIWHSISTDSSKIPQIQHWLALRYTEHLAVVEALALRECRLKFPGLLVACLTPTSIISTFLGRYARVSNYHWSLWSLPYLTFHWKTTFQTHSFFKNRTFQKLCLLFLSWNWLLSEHWVAKCRPNSLSSADEKQASQARTNSAEKCKQCSSVNWRWRQKLKNFNFQYIFRFILQYQSIYFPTKVEDNVKLLPEFQRVILQYIQVRNFSLPAHLCLAVVIGSIASFCPMVISSARTIRPVKRHHGSISQSQLRFYDNDWNLRLDLAT